MSKLSRRKAGRSDVPGPLTSTQKFDADLDEDDDEEVGEKYVARGRRPPRDRDEELFQKQLDEAIRQSTGSSMYDLSSDRINLPNLHHFEFGFYLLHLILLTKLSAVSGKILKGFPVNVNLILSVSMGFRTLFRHPGMLKLLTFYQPRSG